MPTVLIVDDSLVVLHVLGQRLLEAGFKVLTEATATAGRSVDLATVDCAIVDLDLPDGSGCDLAADLKVRRSPLPLAFFTSGAAREILERAREQGPVFLKPDVDDVLAWVKVALQPPPTK